MDTQSTGTHAPALQEVLDGLNDLLQLDHDAIAAYDGAISKLEDRDHAGMIAGYRLDHERHVRELNELVARLGGTPANHPHVTGPFKTRTTGGSVAVVLGNSSVTSSVPPPARAAMARD